MPFALSEASGHARRATSAGICPGELSWRAEAHLPRPSVVRSPRLGMAKRPALRAIGWRLRHSMARQFLLYFSRRNASRPNGSRRNFW
jgi:hypothetical protein